MTWYGIGPSRSATGSAMARHSRTWVSPSATGPADVAMNAVTLRPCHASGITGRGGAVVRLSTAVMSSETPGAHSRNRCMSSWSASAG